MAELQTAYSEDMAPGYAGMVANGETSNRISRTCEDEAGIGFGKPVFAGNDDHGCSGSGTAAEFLGISIANPTLAPVAGSPDTYPQFENVNIATMGAIWVVAGEIIGTARSQAYASSGGDIVDSSSGNTAMDGWIFETAAGNGDLVKLVRR